MYISLWISVHGQYHILWQAVFQKKKMLPAKTLSSFIFAFFFKVFVLFCFVFPKFLYVLYLDSIIKWEGYRKLSFENYEDYNLMV